MKKKGNKQPDQNKNLNKMDSIMPTGVSAPNLLTESFRLTSEKILSEQIEKKANLSKTAQQNFYISQDVPSSFATNVVKTPLVYIDPMFDPILFLFPKDRIDEINKRLRHYYETNPIVGSAIDLHTSVPITDFYLECSDKKNQNFWNDWKDRIGLLEYLRSAIHDYWLLGECFVPEAKVLMADGTEKNICDVRSGDQVITHLGKVKKVLYPTTRIVENEKMFRFKSALGWTSWCTGNHPFLVIKKEQLNCFRKFKRLCVDKEKCKISLINKNEIIECEGVIPSITWTKAEDLEVGDYLLLPEETAKYYSNLNSFSNFYGFYLFKIDTIQTTNYTGRVFNLEVEEHHSYIADKAIVHNCIMLPIWDIYNYEISHFNQYPPENVDIIQTYVTPKKFFLLKPDKKIADKLRSASEFDQKIVSMMDPAYIEALKHNKPYLLGDSDRVIYLARTTTKYRARGVSILSRCLKDLLYMDKLRLLQLTFCDRHLFPIKIFKLGSEQHGWIPSADHFEKFKNLLAQNMSDPSFNIVWHFGVNVDYVGTNDKIANLINEFEFAYKNVMAGLFVNEDMIHGGVSPTVRDTLSVRVLMQRYNEIREKIERVLITHVFLPMARLRKMYKSGYKDYCEKLEKTAQDYVKSKKIKVVGKIIPWEIYKEANSDKIDISAFDIPRPVWKKINIFNNLNEQQNIINLQKEGKLPLSVVLEMLGFDPEVIKKKLEEEEGTIFDNVYQQVKADFLRKENIKEKVLAGKKIKEILKETVPEISTTNTGPSSGISSPEPLGGLMPELSNLPPSPPPLEIPEAPSLSELPEMPPIKEES